VANINSSRNNARDEDEVQRLKAEVQRLTDEVQRLKATTKQTAPDSHSKSAIQQQTPPKKWEVVDGRWVRA
jgi:hypothetical protein